MTDSRHARSSTTPSARAPRHAATRWRPSRVVALGLVGIVAFTLTLGGAVYANLQSQVEPLDIDGLTNPPTDPDGGTEASPADPSAGTALNILVIGSDSRADGAIGSDVDSVLADTHIIVHVAADRSRVELISIPRDIMVDIPDCLTTSGETIPGGFRQYNEAYAAGWNAGGDKESAVACDINLAQSATGLVMDGFVLVEMGGFIDMVDALGGVDICIPEAVDVPKANLVLEAGQQTLTGEQALGYARARVGIDDGSDPSRIERQQRLLSAMVDEILSRDITDGAALYQVLHAALGSLTMSENLSSLTDLAGLALSLRTLSVADVTFLTTPYVDYAPEPGRLQWTEDVQDIWAALAADRPVLADPDQPDGGETAEAPTSSDTTAPQADPTPTDAGTSGASAEDLTGAC